MPRKLANGPCQWALPMGASGCQWAPVGLAKGACQRAAAASRFNFSAQVERLTCVASSLRVDCLSAREWHCIIWPEALHSPIFPSLGRRRSPGPLRCGAFVVKFRRRISPKFSAARRKRRRKRALLLLLFFGNLPVELAASLPLAGEGQTSTSETCAAWQRCGGRKNISPVRLIKPVSCGPQSLAAAWPKACLFSPPTNSIWPPEARGPRAGATRLPVPPFHSLPAADNRPNGGQSGRAHLRPIFPFNSRSIVQRRRRLSGPKLASAPPSRHGKLATASSPPTAIHQARWLAAHRRKCGNGLSRTWNLSKQSQMSLGKGAQTTYCM